jgi:hypothetical protein
MATELTGRLRALFGRLAADVYRADILAVPGSGPVRGLVDIGGVVYAWRNNADATAMAIYKSSATGWTAVSLGHTLPFSTGASTAIVEGNTVSNLAGTATGVVSRVMLTSGDTWIGGSGRLVLSSKTGTWAATDQIRVGGVQKATATDGTTAIALAPGGRVQVVKASLVGGATAPRVYGCDGVNSGFEFDGTTYAPIASGMATDVPTNVAAHKNMLFFSFAGSVQCSGVGLPYVWVPVFGSAEIVADGVVTAMQSLPGDASTAALAVYTESNTWMLYGVDRDSFNFVPFDRGSGAYRYTVQPMSQPYALDKGGVTTLAASQKFGNFATATLTYPVLPYIKDRRGQHRSSIVSRDRSQYRVYYGDGSALYCTLVNGKMLGSMPAYMPEVMNVTASGEDANGNEVLYGGSDTGFVYQLNSGPDFDGESIAFLFELNYGAQGNSRVFKRYRQMALEILGEGYAEFDLGYMLGYGSIDVGQPGLTPFDKTFNAPRWDAFLWDEFTWDETNLSPAEMVLEGSAENISIAIYGDSRLTEPFTVNSAAIHYTPQKVL